MPGPEPAVSGYRERNTTADRALDVLLMFGDERLSLSATEVATHLGVARSTAYRYLQSLVGSQFVEEADGGGYRLGRRVLELARLARRGLGLSEMARPLMRRLATEMGEAVLLTRLAGASVICLEREDPTARAVRISYERGEVLPTNAGASAFALLAWLPDEEVKKVLSRSRLEAFTERTLTDRRAVLARLARTRADGYAVSRGELDRDVLGVAAPVRGEGDRVVAALSIAAFSARVPESRVPELAAAVQLAAAELSEGLALRG